MYSRWAVSLTPESSVANNKVKGVRRAARVVRAVRAKAHRMHSLLICCGQEHASAQTP